MSFRFFCPATRRLGERNTNEVDNRIHVLILTLRPKPESSTGSALWAAGSMYVSNG